MLKGGDKVYFIIAPGRFLNKEPMTGIGFLCTNWEQPSPEGTYTIANMEKWFKYEKRHYADEEQPWAIRFVADFVYPAKITETPLFKALEEK